VRRKAILCILAATIMVLALTYGSMACTSIIVGKNASVTGEVLLGHNEDNGGRLIMPVYLVDHQTHAKGELLQLENNTARIPQAAETARYFWTETRAPLPGASFSDFMYNEYGVVVASDSCASSKVDTSIADLVDNGMGYAIRRSSASAQRPPAKAWNWQHGWWRPTDTSHPAVPTRSATRMKDGFARSLWARRSAPRGCRTMK